MKRKSRSQDGISALFSFCRKASCGLLFDLKMQGGHVMSENREENGGKIGGKNERTSKIADRSTIGQECR